MISQESVQRNAQQYLGLIELDFSKKGEQLQNLKQKIDTSVIKIQRCWRWYFLKKKHTKATIIQRAWTKYWSRKRNDHNKIQKFRRVFFAGKIAYYLQKVYFNSKKSKVKESSSLCDATVTNQPLKVMMATQVVKHFGRKTAFTSALHSESEYVQKIRSYERTKFQKQWERFETQLRKDMLKQIKQKWIKKTKTVYINDSSKEVNVVEYIEKHVSKLFEEHYSRFKHKDEELQRTVLALRQQQQKEQRAYFLKLSANEQKTV